VHGAGRRVRDGYVVDINIRSIQSRAGTEVRSSRAAWQMRRRAAPERRKAWSGLHTHPWRRSDPMRLDAKRGGVHGPWQEPAMTAAAMSAVEKSPSFISFLLFEADCIGCKCQ
jgi:hypothetical protein